MRIPILWQHDQMKPVGQIEGDIATFIPRTVTKATMLECGWETIESEWVGEVEYITKARIVELSVGPRP